MCACEQVCVGVGAMMGVVSGRFLGTPDGGGSAIGCVGRGSLQLLMGVGVCLRHEAVSRPGDLGDRCRF